MKITKIVIGVVVLLVFYSICFMGREEDILKKVDHPKHNIPIMLNEMNSIESTTFIDTLFISSHNEVFQLKGIIHYKYYDKLDNTKTDMDLYMADLVRTYIKYELGKYNEHNRDYSEGIDIINAYIKDRINHECSSLCRIDTIIISNIRFKHSLE